MNTRISKFIRFKVPRGYSFFAALTALGFLLTRNAPARTDTAVNDGWRFMRGDPAGLAGQAMSPADANWNDSGWQTISLPHCWGWEETQQGKMYYRGPGWYRRELNFVPETGRRYFLRFEAASSVADVFLNGRHLGRHRGAFGAFCFEITKELSPGGANLLAVRVSNAAEPDIAPLSGDFPLYGGIYRPVHLIETGEQNITPADHASPGVEWLQTSVSKATAILDLTAEISNGTHQRHGLQLVASIFDANNNLVASNGMQIVAATNMTSPYWLRVTVPHPRLWNGRADPYLYNAVVELRATNGNEVVDSVAQQIGLRFYRVDPDKGFFLNGKYLRLHGVCKHQDRWNKGWAVSSADLDEDIALIKEIGANVVRCAHYQHSDYFYSLCDKAGILVWAEIPQVNAIHDTPEFENTSRNQLLDLIRQNINHPAIFAWSLFNEIGPGSDDPHRELMDLNNVAHSEDPTRPTIAATRTMTFPEMNKIPDLLGWNIYSGWYNPPYGTKEHFGAEFDKFRHSSRRGGFLLSEYGAGANVRQHEQNPKKPKPGGPWHPEEWQAEVHEAAWKAIKARPFIWGSVAWNMFDFTSYFRHEGGSVGLNDKGLVTQDRKTKKDAFYFYKANWSDEPVLYITSRRFVERTNAVTDVKIYSNARKAELFVNGKPLGTRPNDGNAVFIWKNVRLQPGENSIEARAAINGQKLSDRCKWNLRLDK